MLVHRAALWFFGRSAGTQYSRASTNETAAESCASPTRDAVELAAERFKRWTRISIWIVTWYAISITLTLYNKWLFDMYGLSFPLLITAVHFLLKAMLARTAMSLMGLRPRTLNCFHATGRTTLLTGMATATDVATSNLALLYVSVTAYTIVKSSAPIWILFFSVCLGLRRAGVGMICVVIMIVCGITIVATSPVDVPPAGDDNKDDSYGLGGESDADGMGADADADAAAAEAAAEAAAVLERTIGIGLVLVSSLCAGFRWAASQLLLTGRPASTAPASQEQPSEPQAPPSPRQPEASVMPTARVYAANHSADADGNERRPSLSVPAGGEQDVVMGSAEDGLKPVHPYTLVFGTSLSGALLLLPVALLLETHHLRVYLAEHELLGHLFRLYSALGMSLVGGFLAFALLVAEVRVVALTSGLSLSIAGIFKEVLTVVGATLILDEHLTVYKAGGLALCVAGLALYVSMEVRR